MRKQAPRGRAGWKIIVCTHSLLATVLARKCALVHRPARIARTTQEALRLGDDIKSW